MDSVMNIRFWLVNSEGKVLADSVDADMVPDITGEDYDIGILEQNICENVSINQVFQEPMLVCTEPFTYNYKPVGYICAFMPMSIMERQASESIEILNIGMLIIFALLFIIFAAIYFYTVIPVKTI